MHIHTYMENSDTGQRILEVHLWTPGYEPIKGLGTEKENMTVFVQD